MAQFMKDDLRVLLITDDSFESHGLETELKSIGCSSIFAVSTSISVRHVEGYTASFAVIGPSVPLITTLKVIQKLKIVDLTLPIFLTTQDESIKDAAFNGPFTGIHDLRFSKDPGRTAQKIKDAITQGIEGNKGLDPPVLIGISPHIQKIRDKISRISDKDITVLITGESGTGKELIARSIHYFSSRREQPLVKINCGALPEELLESEVFGFQRGAFTHAHHNKPGRLEMAHGGTLFIDEVGNLSLSQQVKFLQILEDKSFSRLGGIRDKVVDVRIVAATNTDLWKMVKEGKFRRDLYYRLNVVRIEAPPLRARREDIPLLADYFANKFCYDYDQAPLSIPLNVMTLLQKYRWPGNIRELENMVRRAITVQGWDFLFKEMEVNPELGISAQEWQFEDDLLLGPWEEGGIDHLFSEKDFSLKKITKKYVAQVERSAIMEALKQTGWNRKMAARLLGVSYKTLLNRMNEYQIYRGLPP